MLIQVVNFEKYNPRSDVKHSSWFRLQNDFWTDPLLTPLDPDQKLVWVVLLSCASKTQKSVFECDEMFFSAALKMEPSRFLETLEYFQAKRKIKIPTSRGRNGRVTTAARIRNANVPLQTDITDTTDRQTNTIPNGMEGTVPVPARAPYSDFLKIWNEKRGALSGVTVLNEARRAKIRARWVERPDLAYWAELVCRMAASTFCCSGGWASFDWLMKNATNHVKVAEGNYDDRAAMNGGLTEEQSRAEVRRLLKEQGIEAE